MLVLININPKLTFVKSIISPMKRVKKPCFQKCAFLISRNESKDKIRFAISKTKRIKQFRRALNIQRFAPFRNICRGEICVLYSTIEKLTYQFRIFLGHLFIFGGILFSLEEICVGKTINLYFPGKFCFWWDFFSWGNLKTLF